MKRELNNRKILSAVALTCAAMLSAKAMADQPVILDTQLGSSTADSNFIANAGAFGFTIQVGSEDLIVNRIGFVDKDLDGLAASHAIGFWLLGDDGNFQTNTLVATDTVAAGLSSLDNGFRYNAVNAPITLLAGQSYSIIGQTAGGGVDNIRDVRFSSTYTTYNINSGIVASPITRFARGGGATASDSPTLHRGINQAFIAANVKVTGVTTRAWTGGSGSNFSAAGNWGGSLPSFATQDAGIAFNSTTPTTVNNDIVGADLRTIRFDAGAPAINVTGNAFTITGSIANNSSNTQTISTGQITTNQSYINAAGGKVIVNSNINIPRSSLILVGTNDVTLNGNLTGSGTLQHGGTGTLLLNGDNSAFTGSIVLNSNTGTLGNVNAVSGKPAMIIVPNPNALGSSSATVVPSVAIATSTNKSVSSAILQINGNGNYTQKLNWSGKDTWQPGTTTQYPQIQSVGNNTWSGPITLTGANINHVVESASGVFTISSNLQATVGAIHNLYLQGPGDIVIGGNITETGTGSIAVTKLGGGTARITASSSWTQPTRIAQGTLELDYTSSATQRLGTATLQMASGNIKFTGNATTGRGENVATLQLAGFSVTSAYGGGSIILNNGAAGTVGLTVGTMTRGVGSTLDVSGAGSLTLPAALGTQSFAGGYITTGGGANWAATDASNRVLPFAAYTADSYAAGVNTDVTTGTTLTGATTNSIRFNTAAATALTLSGSNTLTSGGILVTPSVGANTTTIGGSGTLLSGLSNELILNQYNTAAPLVINAQLFNGNTGSLTKSGPGGVVISSSNSFTGGTSINDGSILVTNANGLQNSSIVVTKNNGLVFQGLSAASIGMISGIGDLNIGAMDLTLTSTTNVGGIYSGKLSGSGKLIHNSVSTNTRLTGDNSGFTGDIIINVGGLVAQTPTALGTTAGKTTVTATSLAGIGNNLGGTLNIRTAVDLNESISIAGRGFDGNTGALRIDNAAHVTFRQPIIIDADPNQAGDPINQTLISIGDDGTAVFPAGITGSVAHPDQNLYLFAGGVLGATSGTNSHTGVAATGSQTGENSIGTISGNVTIGTGTLLIDGAFTLTGNGNVWNGLVATDFATLQIGDGSANGSLGSGSIQLNQQMGNQASDRTINSGNLIFNRAGTMTVSNDISGSTEGSAFGFFGASVQLYGSGTIIFTGNNSYNGGLIIANGTAQAGADNNLGSGSGSISFISNGGTLLATGALSSSSRLVNVGTGAFGVINTNSFNSSVGTISGNGTFHKAGTGELSVGTLNIATLAVDTGRVTVNQNNSTVSRVTALSVGNSASLDLNNTSLSVAYSGATPVAAITALLKTGYNNGAWNGTSITGGSIISTTAATNGLQNTAIGVAEASDLGQASTFALLKYVVYGDADLDGDVDATDFTALSNNFASGTYWAKGDFNYDGKVNALDFNALAAHFGQNAPAPALGTLVPEPASAGVMLALAGAFVARRRRDRRD